MIMVPSAALATALLLPLMIALGDRCGLVDRPGGRKRHDGSVPLVGGLAIYAAMMATGWAAGVFARPEACLFAGLAGLAVAIGVADDLQPLSAKAKLACQAAIATLAVGAGGPMVTTIAGVALGAAGLPVTVLIYIATMNAMNLIDGADGVAGGVAAAALCALFGLAVLSGAPRSDLALIELGSVLGFLAFNLPLRRGSPVFLGDAGSMLLGFSLAWLALGLHRPDGETALAASAWAMGLPLIDMGRVALGRIRRGRSPFAAGRDHLHHLLIDGGMAPLRVALVMTGAALVLAATGIAGFAFELADGPLGVGLFIVGVIYVSTIGGALGEVPVPVPVLAVPAFAPARSSERRDPARRSA